MPRRRIFISYDDADIERVRAFMALRSLREGVEFYDYPPTAASATRRSRGPAS